jgi:hypothetical protein
VVENGRKDGEVGNKGTSGLGPSQRVNGGSR